MSVGLRVDFLIPSCADEWGGRIERACFALDGIFGNALRDCFGNVADRSIRNRKKYIFSRLKRRLRDFSLQLDEGVIVSGAFYDVRCVVYPVTIWFFGDWGVCEKVLVSVGDALNAFSAQFSPVGTGEILHSYHGVMSGVLAFLDRRRDVENAEKLEVLLSMIGRELPLLRSPLGCPDRPQQPANLGWLNYWSPETCAFLGFPDPVRDADLLAHSVRTPGGAWLVRLGNEPLDLENPEHLRLYADVFARFPALGVRAQAPSASAPLQGAHPMSYPHHTAFVQHGSLDKLADGIVALLGEYGLGLQPDASPSSAGVDLEFALFAGTPGWTVLKTRPFEFLDALHSPDHDVPLIELCRRLKAAGCMLSVYDPIQALLFEVDRAGRTHVSGFCPALPDKPSELHRLAADEPSVVEFALLPIHVDMLDLDDCSQLAEDVAIQLAGQNVDLCDDGRFGAALDAGADMAPDVKVLRFRRKPA